MAEGEFGVLVKAKELAVHSFKLTSNCNRYPKKYRVTSKFQRCEMITRAITYCDELLFYIAMLRISIAQNFLSLLEMVLIVDAVILIPTTIPQNMAKNITNA